MSKTVLLSAARTPFGALMGSLSRLQAPALGALAVAGALRRAGITPEQVDRVYLGNVSAHAFKGNPAAAAWDGIGSEHGPDCLTVRAGCVSGLAAVGLALDAIASGACEVAVAGGFESSSCAPHLAAGLRRGLRLGAGSLLDAARHDGPAAIPVGGESEAGTFDRARNNGLFAEEILPVELPARKKVPARSIDKDEGPGLEAAGGKPALADGAAALVLASPEWAAKRKLEPLARLYLVHPPYGRQAESCRFLEADVTAEGVEALGLGPGRAHPGLNARGGPAQMGHAAGADGARLLVSLVHALRQDSGGRGMAFASGSWGETAGVMAEI